MKLATIKAACPVAAIFAVASAVYLCSSEKRLGDSACTVLVAESVLTHGTYSLEGYTSLPDGGQIARPRPLGLFHLFPPGGQVLSIPFVAVAKVFGWTCVGPNNEWLSESERVFQGIVASLLCGGIVACLYSIARHWLAVGPSLLLAAGAGLCTPILNVASSCLWSQTWEMLFICVAILLLQRGKIVWMATALSVAFLCRPMAITAIVPITAFILDRHRGKFIPYAIVGACWLGVLVVWSLSTFGTLLPTYYLSLLPSTDPDEPATAFRALRIWEHLFSTNCGLLFHAPVMLLALAFGLWRSRGQWAALAFAAIGCHLLILACFEHNEDGFRQGCRLMLDIIPWLVVLVAIGMNRLHRRLG